MPDPVSANPGRARYTTLPLHPAMAALRERFVLELPADHPAQGAVNVADTWPNYDLLEDILSTAKQEVLGQGATPSQTIVVPSNECLHSVDLINKEIAKIREMQPWLSRAKHERRHQILRDIAPDCFTTPALLSPHDFIATKFKTAEEARAQSVNLTARLGYVRDIRTQIETAQRHDTLPAGEQAILLVHALADEIAALREEIDQLKRPNRKVAA